MVEHALNALLPVPAEERLSVRYDKFRRMGRENQAFIDTSPEDEPGRGESA